MYAVSEQYKLHIKDQVRGASHMRITLGIEAVGASETVTTEPIEGVGIYSELDKVHRGRPVEKVYHSMEHNRFILDGRGLLPPDPGQPISYYQGYVSEDISSSAGLFSAENPPGITVDFTDPIILRGLTFRFDALMNCYPTSMEINGYFESSLVYSETVSPDATHWVLEDDIPATGYIDSLEILFLSTSPARRRAMLSYLYFGIVKVFTDSEITEATWLREIDLLATKLPKESLTFTVLDVMHEYDPENPMGIWKYLDERQPVQFEYGYEVKRPRSTWGDLLGTTWENLLGTTWGDLYNDTYDTEWLPGGLLYTDGDIKFESEHRIPHVTFRAVPYGIQLDDIYYKGTYTPGGVSYYNLAEALLVEANVPNLPGDVVPYYIDPSLSLISTELPIPEIPIREALQLIANATQSVLYTDRQGMIRLERLSPITPEDFVLDLSSCYEAPKVEKIPMLKSVSTGWSTASATGSVERLVEVEVSYTENTEIRISHDEAYDTNVSVVGVTVVGTPVLGAKSAIVTVIGTGTVKVNGKKVLRNFTSLDYAVAPVGYNCPVTNPLIDKREDAQAYAEWIAGVLQRRTRYEVSNRGFPELDIYDLIGAETLQTPSLNAEITTSEITYNGTLSGRTKYMVKEVES